jgi:hypothetical protein
MPAPQAAVLNAAAVAKFQSFRIQLPAVRGIVGMPSTPPLTKASVVGPELFRAASTSSQDISKQRQMNDQYAKLFQGLSNGFASAWQLFHLSATLRNVTINAVTAVGGNIVCPNLQQTVYLQSSTAGTGQWEGKIRERVAAAFWSCWKQMLDSVSVPGLPWYPAFANLPMPVAPPTPNISTPFIALKKNTAPMAASNLRNAFSNSLQGSMDYHTQFSEALAASIDASFQVWLIQTMVTNVLGTGPVPTFAPPYVPVGPVVGGVGNMTPGGFV